MAYPSICPICDLLECMKELVLWSHDHGLHDLGNDEVSWEFLLGPLLMVCLRSDALNLTKNTLHNEQGELFGPKSVLHDTP